MTTTPTLTDETVRNLAVAEKVCVRPIPHDVTDTLTGDTRTVLVACGATREKACPSCADRARRLRMQQCRDGWHLTNEPAPPDTNDGGPDPEADDSDGQPDDETNSDDEGGPSRRVRSTRRRQDAPGLPSLPVENRTVGRVFEAPNGRRYRPSMFLTLTLPSYGPVTSEGVPVDPGSYDYARAALDAIHLSRLVDRFWQNLRRTTGYNVQYFATLEPQKRLAGHLHAAIRGAIPRRLLRQVVAATYHQVWWPPHNQPVYVAQLPAWDHDTSGYVDPDTRQALPTWDQALDTLDTDPHTEPAHVVRFGRQLDIQGVLAGTPQADRAIGYLTKYLTKNITDDPHDDDTDPTPSRQAHIDRLAEQVRWLPCSPTCANWLRYGIQPKHARPEMVPGYCRSKTHHRDHLGLGGRRVLVSRRWTGKTLTQHRADRAAVVRAVLAEAGVDMDDHNVFSATTTRPDSTPRYVWSIVKPGDTDAPSYLRLISAAIRHRQRWRTQYEQAKTSTEPPRPNLSATATAA